MMWRRRRARARAARKPARRRHPPALATASTPAAPHRQGVPAGTGRGTGQAVRTGGPAALPPPLRPPTDRTLKLTVELAHPRPCLPCLRATISSA